MNALIAQPWFWPAILVIVGLPIALLILHELHNTLVRRNSAYAKPVGLLRNWVLPACAVYLLLGQLEAADADPTWSKVAASVFGFLVMLLLLSGVNAALFGEARTGSWRERLPGIFVDLGRLVLIVLGIGLLLSWVWGANIGGLITAVGVTSIVIGLAVQSAVGPVISGLLLLFEQPFRIGDWLGLTNGDYSIVAWVKTAPGDATESLIVLGKHEAYFNNGYFLNVNHSGFRGQDGKAMFFAGDPIPSPTSTTIVNDGRWHQIVGVYQAGGSTLLYVDGAPVEATTPSYPILGSPAALLIGGLQFEGVPQGLFTGWLDEIRIYRRALSAQEIDALFANPVPPGSGVARVSTLAGTGNSGFADGYGKAVSFASPNGGSVGANRFSYVADAFNQRVRRVDLQSGEVSTIAGNGGAGYTDGPGQNAQFSAPLGVFTSTTSWRTTAEGIWWS